MSASTGATLFGAGRKVDPFPMLKMPVVVVDSMIRCRGPRTWQTGSTGVCGQLLALRAGRPHTHTCRRCGHVNDSEDGSWRP